MSGIGPKLAITILSGMPADAMVAAIKGNNVASLTRIPGIGKKTAERMVLELRDKLERFQRLGRCGCGGIAGGRRRDFRPGQPGLPASRGGESSGAAG